MVRRINGKKLPVKVGFMKNIVKKFKAFDDNFEQKVLRIDGAIKKRAVVFLERKSIERQGRAALRLSTPKLKQWGKYKVIAEEDFLAVERLIKENPNLAKGIIADWNRLTIKAGTNRVGVVFGNSVIGYNFVTISEAVQAMKKMASTSK